MLDEVKLVSYISELNLRSALSYFWAGKLFLCVFLHMARLIAGCYTIFLYLLVQYSGLNSAMMMKTDTNINLK